METLLLALLAGPSCQTTETWILPNCADLVTVSWADSAVVMFRITEWRRAEGHNHSKREHDDLLAILAFVYLVFAALHWVDVMPVLLPFIHRRRWLTEVRKTSKRRRVLSNCS